MSLSDELTKLAELRDRGVLTPDEFEQAKRRLLDSSPSDTRPQAHRSQQSRGTSQGFTIKDHSPNSIGQAANRYVTFQIIMGIIGVILFLIVFFIIFGQGPPRPPMFRP